MSRDVEKQRGGWDGGEKAGGGICGGFFSLYLYRPLSAFVSFSNSLAIYNNNNNNNNKASYR